MLQKNPLQPPRSYRPSMPAAAAPRCRQDAFVSAEDFDATGVLAGVDPCESRYWWIPELHAPESCDAAGGVPAGLQATRRTSPRSPAAA